MPLIKWQKVKKLSMKSSRLGKTPLPDPNPITVRAKVGKVKEVRVLGRKDPRGPDNNIQIWIDADTQELHIRVWKCNRCYAFKEVIEESGFIEVVAK